MSIRTIEAPGVQINEIDKSAYTPAMTGTRAYVMGYANKGEPYIPMQFTSKSAWQLYYGEPDNEAERYFYNACSEVINQNGVLYCARLPYDNDAYGKMVGYKYKVGTKTINNPDAGSYILENPNVRAKVSHNSQFEQAALKWCFDNKCMREVDGVLEDGLENDTEIEEFYNAVITRYNMTYGQLYSSQRKSIYYYQADTEASQSLFKRFLTREEAEDYLQDLHGVGVPGKWKYVVTNDGEAKSEKVVDGKIVDVNYYNILSDNGDWIAVPLCCTFVTEISALSDFGKVTNIETVSDLCSIVNDVSKDVGLALGLSVKVDEDLQTMQDMKDNLTAMVDALNDDTTGQLEIVSDLCCIVYDINKNGKYQKKGEEIKLFGYAQSRTNELDGLADSIIDIGDLNPYNHESIPSIGGMISSLGGSNTKFLVKTNYAVKSVADGGNNEFMFDTVVSALYADQKLELSNNADISTLYATELWNDYKARSLGFILRQGQKYASSMKEMRADYTNPENYITSFYDMITKYAEEGNIKYQDLMDMGTLTLQEINADVPYFRIVDLDSEMNNYLPIHNTVQPINVDLDSVDAYRTGEEKVPVDSFYIVDKTCATLNSITEDKRKGLERQMIGIFPVVTTAANALYAQSLLTCTTEEITNYETVNGVITKSFELNGETKNNTLLTSDVSMRFYQGDKTEDEESAGSAIDTVSRQANEYFLPIGMKPDLSGVDTDNMKKIGVVVYKAYLDASEGNKVSFNLVESFCGSLDKTAKNPNTGVSTFIDDIINSQSDYIYFFSNCLASTAAKKEFNNVADFYIMDQHKAPMLGFFTDETEETISLPSIYQGIDKCFKNVEDINERDIDIICDAGLANIAQYLKSIYGSSTRAKYDLDVVDEGGNPLIKNWKIDADNVSAWKTVQFKYDNFCKNVRKDCMFIADGPRPLVLQGQKKIVRTSKPSNTIDANILPNVKFITGLNTNYGAGYCDWFKVTDEFSGDEFWCPPSIKAMGVYINTDLNFEYWDAPAGLNRGVIQALDCAFSPTVKQAGAIYTKNWNYAINYPNDGIVLEGQKTFQVKPSAFDRVNVRRLFLRLERQSYKVARYFVYEGNTAYTRQRLVDMLDPLFSQAKIGGGIYDYKIICDESINTATVIDNNELRVKIGIKPTKTAEFILIDFIALSTGGSFSEM